MNIRFFRHVALAFALLSGAGAQAGNLAEPDQAFLEQAAQNGHADMSASRLALTKARDPRVRTWAQRTIDDHERVDAELNRLAESRNYKPPKEPSMLQKGKEMVLANLSDDSFDQRYIEQVGIEAHESTIRLFEEAARSARDPLVKAFANKHLPALRDHLKTARELQATMDSGKATSRKP